MSSSPIYNAILRIDGISGTSPLPFERPNHELDLWVLELPCQHLGVVDWCAQTTRILSDQTDLLLRAHLAGGRSSLFIESAAAAPVLRLEANFLEVLSNLDISLECAYAAN